MKKGIFTLLFIGILILGLSANASAQKFGFLNYNNLLLEMPETKAADSKLEAFSAQLSKQLEGKAKTLQEKFTKAQQDVQAGNKTPVQVKQLEDELEKERQALALEERNSQQKVLEKREELYKPIFEKVNKAIKEVGEEGGYLFIFNESTGVILFDDTTDDVSALVKAKLGM